MSKNSNGNGKETRPRKLGALWQVYQFWREMTTGQRAHLQRIDRIQKGVSTMDNTMEQTILDMVPYEKFIKFADKTMIDLGATAGPIWDWLRTIKGLKSGHITAILLAQIDDIGRFDTVSKLWRFAGLAVIDGKAEYGTSSYNRRLKALMIGEKGIACAFVNQHTWPYRDIYDEEKERLYELHPVPLCNTCNVECVKGSKWQCPQCGATNSATKSGYRLRYVPCHIDKMARRKIAKIFLQHLWVKWREFEGLPISKPYVEGILGHEHIIPPPEEA
jgi:ribosomal protein L37AE/L43A